MCIDARRLHFNFKRVPFFVCLFALMALDDEAVCKQHRSTTGLQLRSIGFVHFHLEYAFCIL